MRKNKPGQVIDLHDNAHDAQRLRRDEASFELPDVEDIPGQKKNQPESKPAIIPDTTASSTDEEGDRILLDPLNTEEINESESVNSEDRNLQSDSYDDQEEPGLYEEISLENRDLEGDALNEKSLEQDLFGEDLDSDHVAEEDAEDE
jgi:hypothetical protein